MLVISIVYYLHQMSASVRLVCDLDSVSDGLPHLIDGSLQQLDDRSARSNLQMKTLLCTIGNQQVEKSGI